MNPWFAFWIFLGCAALAIGYANSGPSQLEIDAQTRGAIAAQWAKEGKSPFLINCLLTYRYRIFTSECDKAMAEASR